MSAFDRIIGFDSIKNDLLGIIDIIKNPDIYRNLGAEIPHGVMLEGDPGMGKTLMAKAFIEECGIPSFVIRRSKSSDDFIEEMNNVFEEASRHGRAVILLDDIDKMAPEEKNSQEYSVLQALIDSVHDKEVFIIATANCTHDLPDSLTRAGRFDRWIMVRSPSRLDGEKIVKYYISKKPISEDVNLEDVCKMLSYRSCASIDSVVNLAAIAAGRARSEKIQMHHLVNATLTEAYGLIDTCEGLSHEEREMVAYHEAGHAVICDIIKEGSVGVVSICSNQRADKGGFMLRCEELDRRPYDILVSLGGKAACEIKYGRVASGTKSDLSKACQNINISTKYMGAYGVANLGFGSESEFQDQRSEVIVTAELERHLFKAKEILAENREYLDKLAKALYEKETLLNSEIAAIRATCTIKPAVIG